MFEIKTSALNLAAIIAALPLTGLSQTQSGGSGKKAESEQVLLESMPAIETAALYSQTLQEAPANVTIITEREIRTYGYRTIAEALSNVRGFYITSDGALNYSGIRGFSLPGDYNTRILVLVNGHYMTDNVYGAMYMFGQDFNIDMDLIQRIEIVRGPSSALYGSNGIFATINIFTRSPADSPALRASTELGSFGEKKGLISGAAHLGGSANLLMSSSVFYQAGRTVRFPELSSVEPHFGRTGSVGAERGYNAFAHLTWSNWSFMASFGDRKINVPTGWYGSDFGDPGTSSRDAHNFIETAWSRDVGRRWNFRWSAYYDQFRYFGRYDYTYEGVPTSDTEDHALGDWVGSRVVWRTSLPKLGPLTFGGQVNTDLRNVQYTYIAPDRDVLSRNTSQRDASYGLFVQQEWNLSPRWTLFAGARFDDSRLDKPFVSPRAAVIYRPSETSSYKLMYGRAFRNPSTFERFWEPNRDLDAERMNSIELSREVRVMKTDLTALVYYYQLSGLIEGVPVSDITLQYRNVAESHAAGAEFEARTQLFGRLSAAASMNLQGTHYDPEVRGFPNSPARLAQARVAVPLVQNRLTLAGVMRYLSRRNTMSSSTVDPVWLGDVTLTTHRLFRGFDLQFGVRNIADHRYSDPLSEEHLTKTMPRAGRSVFFKLIWLAGD